MHAVDPERVRENARRLTADEIADELKAACDPYPVPRLIILSGGNPALHDLGGLVTRLGADGHLCSVETQGSAWRPWLKQMGVRVVVSPKPPSSGMVSDEHARQLWEFMAQQGELGVHALKIVVFDDLDYDWAWNTWRTFQNTPLYLSAGTPQNVAPASFGPIKMTPKDTIRCVVADRYAWLAEKVSRDPRVAMLPPLARQPVVLPQLHVIAWGAAQGV